MESNTPLQVSILAQIQAKVKAPKAKYNAFGKYKYRSCESILEAVKPIISEYGFSLQMSDSVIKLGARYYIKATVILTNGTDAFTAIGYAREEDVKKGMDASQITGAASSYARKYALNGLFAIDESNDSDTTNTDTPEENKFGYKEIGECKTLQQLEDFWNANKENQKLREFVNEVAVRKEELTNGI
jgi:hypothetical protein